jgi:acyl carrier protein
LPRLEELRAFLARTLPPFMIPAVFVPMAELPRTPSGKTDRKRLPAPDSERVWLASAYVAPSGPLETAVAEVFAAVLGVERVGLHDDFFALGGSSLQLTQLAARLDQRFAADLELDLAGVYGEPTVAGVAKAVEASGAADRWLARRERYLARIDQLSEEELDRLLSAKNEPESGA